MAKPSPNIATYEKIFQLRQEDGTTSLSDLIRKYKVKYINYHNWVKRHKKPKTKAPSMKAPLNKGPGRGLVIVRVPLEEIISAIRNKRKDITIPTDRILNALPEEEQTKLLVEVGRMFLGPSAPSKKPVQEARRDSSNGDDPESFNPYGYETKSQDD